MTGSTPRSALQSSALLCLLLALLPGLASASNGIFEINQTCAVSIGCFPGDDPGFPVQISNSGSFALTGDLTLPDENTNGIEIVEDGVTIDLGGFTIAGPGLVGSGNGIFSPSPGGGDFVRVRNGSIVGVGARGVRLLDTSSVVDVTVENSGGTGIAVSNGTMVIRCRVDEAGEDGIVVAGGITVDSHVYGAAGRGIRTFGLAIVLGSSAIGASMLGLSNSGPSGFADSYFIENNGGLFNQQVGGFWFDMGGSFCGQNTPNTCP